MTPDPSLPGDARLTRLTLRTRDREAQLGFYRDVLGLEVIDEAQDRLVLAPAGRQVELTLLVEPDAPRRPHPSVGLYHLALLVPSRSDLAEVLAGLQAAGVQLDGAADHGVSEALYLSDPEGNGIEIYRDRDPAGWPRQGDEIAMVTRRLDVEDLLAQGSGPSKLPAGTRLGHVHLHVPDLEAAGRFHQDLGLEITQSTYPGALFLAAGGYHHHVGLNTWAGHRMAPEGATGLVSYTWAAPGADLDAIEEALTAAGRGPRLDLEQGVLAVEDTAGVEVRLTTA